MELIENSLNEPIDEVLERPLFCFVATASREGDPRVSPLWFHWEDETMWMIGDTRKTYTTRIERHPQIAVAIIDFDVTEGRVQHIGMRGVASLEPLDEDIVERKLTRYLGPDRETWDRGFVDLDHDRWRLIKFEPESVVARDQSYMATGSQS